MDAYDGSKNYFTFIAYVQQPWSYGLGMFGMMNYPYGDYIFYTDNTPLLAVPVRLWSHYIFDVTPYALDIYHALLLAGFLLSTALLTDILRRLLRHWGLVIIFAVVLPWLNPQTGRLFNGHFNLAYSFVPLLAIWGLLVLYTRIKNGQAVRSWLIGLIISFALTGLLHLYYLPLLALTTGGFFAWWLLSQGQWRFSLAGIGMLLTLLPTGLCFGIIRLVDGYYRLRSAGASGFNSPPWKLQLSALIRSYSYDRTHFWLEPQAQPTYESVAYLGAFALFGLTLAGGAWLVRRQAVQQMMAAWRPSLQRQFLGFLLGAALIGLAISIGTTYEVFDGQYVFHNYFSAFYYLQKITDAVTQFRTVARFSWPFFWAVNFLVLVGLDFWLSYSRWRGRWIVAILLVFLAWLDTRDTLKFYRGSLVANPLTDIRRTENINQLLFSAETTDYQAILPIPFFHVGSEDMELTVDDHNPHSLQCYQLSLRTNLPLMASKMSRTPPEQMKQLRSLFDPSGPSPELLGRLRKVGKPILVFFDQSYYDGSNPIEELKSNPKARALIDAGAEFPTRNHLTLVAEAGKLRLYRWDVR
ncbi:hypothetical protein [Hymenobacter tenuis]